MSTNRLVQKQVERRLEPWHKLRNQMPGTGWLSTIRQALGMSATQLGERIGMTRQGVADLERREREESATLAVLRKAAEGMNCDLVYAIVPRASLADLRRKQATDSAAREIGRVAHTMGLEDQATGPEEVKRLVEERADELLRTGGKALWRNREEPARKQRRTKPQ
ncbi:MAG: mobile mystery protein A [Gemmatimonadota bacterium]